MEMPEDIPVKTAALAALKEAGKVKVIPVTIVQSAAKEHGVKTTDLMRYLQTWGMEISF